MANNYELLHEVTVPLYVRSYVKSNSVREKYYIKGKGKEIPAKCCNKVVYDAQGVREPDGVVYNWKEFPVTRQGKKFKQDFLVEVATGKRVIANEVHVGKQQMHNINGQDIYNGNVARHERNKMLGVIKDQFRTAFKHLPAITRYPLKMEVFLFDTVIDDTFSNGQDWDVDNRFFPYGKGLADLLKKEGKIVDDNRYYITAPPHAIFVPVEEDHDRRFIVRIYKDNRPIILNNWLYKQKHGSNLL